VDPDGEYALGSEANANSRSVAGNSSRRFNAVSGGATDRNAKTSQALKESLERTSLLDDVSETTRAMYGNSGYSDQTLKCLQVRIARFPNPSAHCFTEADDCLSIHRDIQD
jgi:hypothetical protein